MDRKKFLINLHSLQLWKAMSPIISLPSPPKVMELLGLASTNSITLPLIRAIPLWWANKTFTIYNSAWCSSVPLLLLLSFLMMQVEWTPALSAFGAFTKESRSQSLLKPQLKCFFIFIHHFSIQIPWESAWLGSLSFLQAIHVYMEAGLMSVGPTSHSLHRTIQDLKY